MLANASRLLRLLTLLQSRRDWSGAELADRLGISVRTLRRDVDKLRELDYPVRAGTGPGARYRLGSGVALPPLVLDDDEAIAVAVALRTVAGGGVTDIGETALRALMKLEQVLPSRLRHRVGAFQIDTVPVAADGPAVDTDLLTLVATACRDRQLLRFDYRSYDDTASVRRTEPYRLVSWGRRWYLVAWDLDREGWRSFRLDRLRPYIPVGPRFADTRQPPDNGDAASFLSRSVSDVWPIQASVLLRAPAETIRDRIWPLHGRLEPVDGQTCRLYLGAETPRMLAYLLSVLDVDFTVESPPEMVAHLHAVAARFERAAESSGGRRD
jgi:predicted DNA-binding transcriptional regulator YafY